MSGAAPQEPRPLTADRGTVLILEPRESLGELLEGLLCDGGFQCQRAHTPEEAGARLAAGAIEVLLISETAGEPLLVERLPGATALSAPRILLTSDEARIVLDGPTLRVLLKPSELDLILFEVHAAAALARGRLRSGASRLDAHRRTASSARV